MTQLPVGNEPLVLADGTKIDTATGKVMRDTANAFVAVPSNREAQKIIARTRRTIGELPAPPQELSAVALVAFYTLYGLGDNDIAIALDGKLTVDQIKNVRELDAYVEFMDSAKANILHTESTSVREVFEQNAFAAANRVAELAASDNDVLAFKASQDILDRAGHRPADVVEHRHKMEDALQIVIKKVDTTKEVPMIDVTPNFVEKEDA